MSQFGAIENIIKFIKENSALSPKALQDKLHEFDLHHRRIPKELLAEILVILKQEYDASELIAELKKHEDNTTLDGFEVDVYAKLLAYTKLSQFIEGSLEPTKDAYKLTIIFGNEQKAISYLHQYNQHNPHSTRSIEEACNFSLPKGTNWDLEAWRAIFEKNLIYKKFRRSTIIAYAEIIQEKLLSTGYVLKNQDNNDIKLNDIKGKIEKINVLLENKRLETRLNDDVIRMLRKEIAQTVPAHRTRLSKLEKEIKSIQAKKQEVADPTNLAKLIIERDVLKLKIEKAVPLEQKNALDEAILAQKQFKSEINKLKSQLEERKKQLPILLKDVSLKKLEKLAIRIQYLEAKQDKEAARIFKKYGLSKYDFTRYLELKSIEQSQKTTYEKLRKKDHSLLEIDQILPEIIIDGTKNDCKGYYIIKLNKDDPKGAVLGHITACCQSIDAQGVGCAEHGISNINGGFYVLCKGTPPKNGNTHLIAPRNIIAQAWAWRGEDNTIVLDSIEAQPNILSSSRNAEIIRKMYHLLGNDLATNTKVNAVNVGVGSKTPSYVGYSPLQESIQPVETKGLIENHPHYHDSTIQRELARKEKLLYSEFFINLDDALEKYIQMPRKSKEQYDKNVLVDILLRIGKSAQLEKLLSNLMDPTEMKDYLQKNQCFKKAIEYPNLDLIAYLGKLDPEIDLHQSIQVAAFEGDAGLMNALMDLVPKDSIEYLGVALYTQSLRISNTNPAMIKALLASWEEKINTYEININQKDESGRNLLWYAVKAGENNLARRIILSGKAHLDELSVESSTMLLDAAIQGPSDIIRLLLKKTKNIHQVNESNENMLTVYMSQVSSLLQDERLIRYMVNRGVQVTEQTLTYAKAAENNGQLHSTTYKMLLSEYLKTQLPSEEEINTKDNQGKTPLMRALDSKNELLIELLLDKGADIHSKDNTDRSVLHYAVLSGHSKFIQKMLELSPDIIALDAPVIPEDNSLGYEMPTSLVLAIQTENIEIVKLLLENGYPVNAKSSYSLFERMKDVDKPRTKEIISLLLQHGATPFDDPTFERRKPFHFERIVNLWLNEMIGKLEKPGTIDDLHSKGRTLLMLAVQYGDKSLVKKIVLKGALINTPIMNHIQVALENPTLTQQRRAQLESIQMFLNSQIQRGSTSRPPVVNFSTRQRIQVTSTAGPSFSNDQEPEKPNNGKYKKKEF